MITHRYRALAEDGRRVRGELDAADLADLEQRLRAQGLVLITGRPEIRIAWGDMNTWVKLGQARSRTG